jgi:hypothetical protein
MGGGFPAPGVLSTAKTTNTATNTGSSRPEIQQPAPNPFASLFPPPGTGNLPTAGAGLMGGMNLAFMQQLPGSMGDDAGESFHGPLDHLRLPPRFSKFNYRYDRFFLLRLRAECPDKLS